MTAPTTARRCPWAIKLVTLNSRCYLGEGHVNGTRLMHEANGFHEVEEQRLTWMPGDWREYRTTRDDEYAWMDQFGGDVA